jgi:hypothetical protein
MHVSRGGVTTLSPSGEKAAPGLAPSAGGERTIYATVTSLFFNPRLLEVHDEENRIHQVVVGDARKFWLGAPVLIRPSLDYGSEFYELAADPPIFKGDKRYAERIEREREAIR